jgi:hypothetical protein
LVRDVERRTIHSTLSAGDDFKGNHMRHRMFI